MNSDMTEYVGHCFDSSKNLLILRQILKLAQQSTSGHVLFDTLEVPISMDEVVDYLEKIMVKGVIQIPDFKETLEIGPQSILNQEDDQEVDYYLFSLILPQDFLKKYNATLERARDDLLNNPNQMSFDRQIAIVRESVVKKKKLLGKPLISFSYSDLTKDEMGFVHLYFILLYLEKDKVVEIGDIRSVPQSEKWLEFTLNLKDHLIKGDNYVIDLENCTIKFNGDDRSIKFTKGHEVYRLLRLFYDHDKSAIEHREVAKSVSKSTVGDGEDCKNYNKAMLGRIRKDVLNTSYKGDRDIFINKKGFIELRGVSM